jgi:hypothetical protein
MKHIVVLSQEIEELDELNKNMSFWNETYESNYSTFCVFATVCYGVISEELFQLKRDHLLVARELCHEPWLDYHLYTQAKHKARNPTVQSTPFKATRKQVPAAANNRQTKQISGFNGTSLDRQTSDAGAKQKTWIYFCALDPTGDSDPLFL